MSRLVDSNIAFITIDKGICNECVNVFANGENCKAYPRGIPVEILTGKVNHRKPYKGDNGIQFEPVEEIK